MAQVASEYNLATTKIKNIVAGEPTNTTDNNLRFVGATPYNYVSFNDEAITSGSKYYMIYQPDSSVKFGPVETEEECVYLSGTSGNYYCTQISRNYLSGWRIVGVMNNIDDGCPRATSWVGKIALMNISDYGYAVGGTSRDLCVNQTTVNNYWRNSDCLSNDWIFDSTRPAATAYLTPYSNNATSNYVQLTTGQLGNNTGKGEFEILPTIYLKSTVTITGGSGTPDDPYTLG